MSSSDLGGDPAGDDARHELSEVLDRLEQLVVSFELEPWLIDDVHETARTVVMNAYLMLRNVIADPDRGWSDGIRSAVEDEKEKLQYDHYIPTLNALRSLKRMLEEDSTTHAGGLSVGELRGYQDDLNALDDQQKRTILAVKNFFKKFTEIYNSL
jgi:hypothetical protein